MGFQQSPDTLKLQKLDDLEQKLSRLDAYTMSALDGIREDTTNIEGKIGAIDAAFPEIKSKFVDLENSAKNRLDKLERALGEGDSKPSGLDRQFLLSQIDKLYTENANIRTQLEDLRQRTSLLRISKIVAAAFLLVIFCFVMGIKLILHF